MDADEAWKITKTIDELIEKLKQVIPKYRDFTYPIIASGACKLHYHEDCGYSKCECLCHNKTAEPLLKDAERATKLINQLAGTAEQSLPNGIPDELICNECMGKVKLKNGMGKCEECDTSYGPVTERTPIDDKIKELEARLTIIDPKDPGVEFTHDTIRILKQIQYKQGIPISKIKARINVLSTDGHCNYAERMELERLLKGQDKESVPKKGKKKNE